MEYSFKVIIEKDRCKGCELCIVNCPKKILKFSSGLNKKGVKYAQVERVVECIGCGFCFLICPECCVEISDGEKAKK